jgi:hypothetical protein
MPGMFNLAPARLDSAIQQLDAINPALPALAVNAGILTDPGYLPYVTDPGTAFEPVYGGYNPALILPDILGLFGIEAGQVDVSQLVDPGALTSGFDAAMTSDLGTSLTAFDPAALSAEFAALLENFGAALGPDLATSLLDLV